MVLNHAYRFNRFVYDAYFCVNGRENSTNDERRRAYGSYEQVEGEHQTRKKKRNEKDRT